MINFMRSVLFLSLSIFLIHLLASCKTGRYQAPKEVDQQQVTYVNIKCKGEFTEVM